MVSRRFTLIKCTQMSADARLGKDRADFVWMNPYLSQMEILLRDWGFFTTENTESTEGTEAGA